MQLQELMIASPASSRPVECSDKDRQEANFTSLHRLLPACEDSNAVNTFQNDDDGSGLGAVGDWEHTDVKLGTIPL